MGKPTPTVRRLQLGWELRRLRDERGTPREKVLKELGWHGSKLSKVEQGEGTVSVTEIEALVRLLAMSENEADWFRAIGKEARKRGKYGKVPDWARNLIGMEAAATELWTYESEAVPGLMQTHAYARAIIASSPLVNPANTDELATTRANRSRLLHDADSPHVSAVVSEAALRRVVGGADVMRDQLTTLLELADLPSVTLQVLSDSAGAHAAMNSSFVVLHLLEPKLSTVYLEDLTKADYLDHPSTVEAYTLVFARLQEAALDQVETVDLINRAREEIKQ